MLQWNVAGRGLHCMTCLRAAYRLPILKVHMQRPGAGCGPRRHGLHAAYSPACLKQTAISCLNVADSMYNGRRPGQNANLLGKPWVNGSPSGAPAGPVQATCLSALPPVPELTSPSQGPPPAEPESGIKTDGTLPGPADTRGTCRVRALPAAQGCGTASGTAVLCELQVFMRELCAT